MSSTSQAAPQVSRIAAKILDLNSSFTPEEIKEIIIRTVDQRENLQGKLRSGGEMNELRALSLAETILK